MFVCWVILNYVCRCVCAFIYQLPFDCANIQTYMCIYVHTYLYGYFIQAILWLYVNININHQWWLFVVIKNHLTTKYYIHPHEYMYVDEPILIRRIQIHLFIWAFIKRDLKTSGDNLHYHSNIFIHTYVYFSIHSKQM